MQYVYYHNFFICIDKRKKMEKNQKTEVKKNTFIMTFNDNYTCNNILLTAIPNAVQNITANLTLYLNNSLARHIETRDIFEEYLPVLCVDKKQL